MAVVLDHESLRRAIATYVGIVAPSAVVAVVAGGSNSSTATVFLVAAVLVIFVVAPFVAGGIAGGDQASPFVHGALAVALPGGAFLVVRVVVGAVQANLTAVDVVTFILYFVIDLGLGMLGGYRGFRRRQRLA